MSLQIDEKFEVVVAKTVSSLVVIKDEAKLPDGEFDSMCRIAMRRFLAMEERRRTDEDNSKKG